MLIKEVFDGALMVDLPEGYDLDLDICDDVAEEQETYIDLNDEIFGMDHDKMKYFNDGGHSLVFKTEVLGKVKASRNYDALTADAIPLTTDGGVKKLVLRDGNGGSPHDGAQIWVHSISFVEGKSKPFDATKDRQRLDTFKLDGHMLPYMDIALRSMKFEEVAMFISEPNYAYGRLGCPPRIPAGARILVIIELMDMRASREIPLFMKPSTERQNLSLDCIIAESERLREFAVRKLKAEDFVGSEQTYDISIKILQEYRTTGSADRARIAQSLYKSLVGLAQCHLESTDFEAVGNTVDRARALRINMPDSKLLFSYAKALIGLDLHAKALSALKEALDIEPEQSDVQSLYDEVKGKTTEEENNKTKLDQNAEPDCRVLASENGFTGKQPAAEQTKSTSEKNLFARLFTDTLSLANDVTRTLNRL